MVATTKPGLRPPKKNRAKLAAPETADEFQEAADHEEETGGKWRVGDSAKSGRAFVRALDVYDCGLHRYPSNFDLAYNKARLQLEITQQPPLVEHIGLPLSELLAQTLTSHRYALKLKDDNPDVLFNTSQVLISLAEQLSQAGDFDSAILQLQEALELLSACLSRQEMMFEEQLAEFEAANESGVALDPDEKLASPDESEPMEQTAMIEVPVSASDLLDTVHASLSALTTLVPLTDQARLQNLGSMAESLTDEKAPTYVAMLPSDLHDAARTTLLLDRAIFVAAFADAQFNYRLVDWDTYLDRLDTSFQIPDKAENAHVLSTEGEARTEMVLSALDRSEDGESSPAQLCWKQLALSQDLYTQATKLKSEDAKERKAKTYKLKGDLELLRTRLALLPAADLDASVKRSAQTLVVNATTFYKGAAQLARNDGDSELQSTAQQRWLIATDTAAFLFQVEPKPAPFEFEPGSVKGDLLAAVALCVDEGILDARVGEQIVRRIGQQ